MKQLENQIDVLIKNEGLPWERSGHTIKIAISGGSRQQKVNISRNSNLYEISSIVLRGKAIKNDKNLYDIAYRAFRKNAHKELVNFSFDNNGNLVGLITQPVEYLHDAELKLYINVIAQECDRFEYKLTGEDKE